MQSLKDLVDNFTPGGCYAIEWELDGDKLRHKSDYTSQWWADGVAAKELTGFYAAESAKFEFPVGEGFVGRVFEKQRVLFVKDLQDLDREGIAAAMQSGGSLEYMRAGLAKEFSIHSAIFLPQPNGVVEVGSAATVAAMPASYAPYAGPTTPPVAAGTGEAAGPDLRSKEEPPQLLKSLVHDLTLGSCYGMEWVWDGNHLKYRSHCHPQWRIDAVLKQGLKGLYTTQSSTFTFEKGSGLVGEAFDKQSVIFAKDLQSLPPEDVTTAMQTGVNTVYLRRDIAEQFGIHSAFFLPTSDGVLEVGSTKMLGSLEEFFGETARKAIAGKTAAADILSALTGLAV